MDTEASELDNTIQAEDASLLLARGKKRRKAEREKMRRKRIIIGVQRLKEIIYRHEKDASLRPTKLEILRRTNAFFVKYSKIKQNKLILKMKGFDVATGVILGFIKSKISLEFQTRVLNKLYDRRANEFKTIRLSDVGNSYGQFNPESIYQSNTIGFTRCNSTSRENQQLNCFESVNARTQEEPKDDRHQSSSSNWIHQQGRMNSSQLIPFGLRTPYITDSHNNQQRQMPNVSRPYAPTNQYPNFYCRSNYPMSNQPQISNQFSIYVPQPTLIPGNLFEGVVNPTPYLYQQNHQYIPFNSIIMPHPHISYGHHSMHHQYVNDNLARIMSTPHRGLLRLNTLDLYQFH